MAIGDASSRVSVGSSLMTATIQTATAKVKASSSELRLPQTQRSGRTASISRSFDPRPARSDQPVAQPARDARDPAGTVESGQDVPQSAAIQLADHLAVV